MTYGTISRDLFQLSHLPPGVAVCYADFFAPNLPSR
jgi:hypothetical protein